MKETVSYDELSPDAFKQRIEQHPIGYLPLGTLEWHGAQNVLGADAIQARGLFMRAAEMYGGIVFPPLWVGPDRVCKEGEGKWLMGMDSHRMTQPNQQLPGSCYWVQKGLFLLLLESIVSQAKRAGFRCLIADGHGPSRKAWAEMVDIWEKQYDIILLSAIRDFEGTSWKTQMDHAGKNETSAMMALRPELVHLDRLPVDRFEWPLGVMGEDPRDSSADFGESLLASTVKAIGAKLHNLGL